MKAKVYDYKGDFISEFEVVVDDGDDKRNIFISMDDPNCLEENFTLGNLVKIGDWEGVMWTPRTWEADRMWVTVYKRKVK